MIPNPSQMPNQAPLPPDLAKIPTQEAVEALLRNNILRRFIVDIEVDSTILGDQQADQQRRQEFIKSVGTFIGQILPVCQTQPKLVPYMGQLLQFGVKGFPVARDLITATDQLVEQLEQQAAQAEAQKSNQPPPPNPEALKLETAKIKAQAEAGSDQAAIQQQQIQSQADIAVAKAKLEQTQLEHQHTIAKMNMDHEATKAKYVQDMSLQQKKAELENFKHEQMRQQVVNQLPTDNILHAPQGNIQTPQNPVVNQNPALTNVLDNAMHKHLDGLMAKHFAKQNT